MENTTPQEPLKFGVDFYVENGRWVFTAHFLTKRGYCCASGCRHCPYGFPKADRSPEIDITGRSESS